MPYVWLSYVIDKYECKNIAATFITLESVKKIFYLHFSSMWFFRKMKVYLYWNVSLEIYNNWKRFRNSALHETWQDSNIPEVPLAL
jgi:hypothetical protein